MPPPTSGKPRLLRRRAFPILSLLLPEEVDTDAEFRSCSRDYRSLSNANKSTTSRWHYSLPHPQYTSDDAHHAAALVSQTEHRLAAYNAELFNRLTIVTVALALQLLRVRL
jgi:hypothetical protein